VKRINKPAVVSTMAAELTGRRKPTKPKKQLGAQKRKRDDVDVEKLEQAVENLVCLI
jgi:ATP-dependent RNA helicase DDX10/DBP4